VEKKNSLLIYTSTKEYNSVASKEREHYIKSMDNYIIFLAIQSKAQQMIKLVFQLILFVLFQFTYSIHVNAEIYVGTSTPLSGPLQEVGLNAIAGIKAYFNRINTNGGIQGQKLQLIIEDDQYEPGLAAPNMRKLINDYNVIAVIANVGTPTAVVTVPIAVEKNIPLIGAITGAPLLRETPPNRYIFNYRASYSEEAASMVDGLLKAGIKPEEIAFFSQRDSYGDAGYDGAISALQEHNFKNTYSLAHGRYTRNSLNVEGALATILDAPVKPKAIIMAGSYAPSAKFIKLAKQDLPDCLFLNLSFVGSKPLIKELGNETDNVIITQVVPSFDSDLPIAKDFKHDLKILDTQIEPNFISFESYIVAKIFVSAIESIKGQIINSDALVNSLHQLTNLDIGLDQDISYSESKHQAVHKVWPVMINNGTFIPVNWEKLGEKLGTSIVKNM
jgi:ABC-type branched-subunit amino acid transport system substrate-binding protein